MWFNPIQANIPFLYSLKWSIDLKQVNPFHSSVPFHIETSHLFCRSKQMTGFYMKCNFGWQGVILFKGRWFYSFFFLFLFWQFYWLSLNFFISPLFQNLLGLEEKTDVRVFFYNLQKWKCIIRLTEFCELLHLFPFKG